MVSRRLLRIKSLHILYAYIQTPEKSMNQAEKELFFSINKAYDLYFLHISLFSDLLKLANDKIDKAKLKRLPTEEDLTPNTRFIENKVLLQLTQNQQYLDYVAKHKISWNDKEELIRHLFNTLLESEVYSNYMALSDRKYSDDQEFVIQIIEEIFAENEFLIQTLEDMSIFWNDDFEFVLSMLIRTIESMKIGNTHIKRLIQLFNNEEDIEFVKTLFRKTILNKKQYEAVIDKHIQNWELDRIAHMDILVLIMALAEVTNLESIPVKVTMNEYIELSKYYSTEKSSEFINGVLENAIEELKKEGKFQKIGRGLV